MAANPTATPGRSSAPRKNAGTPTKTKTSPSKVPANTLIEKIVSNRGRLSRLRSGYRKERRRILSQAVVEGLKLRAAGITEWTRFIGLPFWNGKPKARPKVDERAKAVHFVVRIYCNDDNRAAKIASEVSLAVDHLLSEGLTPDRIGNEIINGKSIRQINDGARVNPTANLQPNDNGALGGTRKTTGNRAVEQSPVLEVQADAARLAEILALPVGSRRQIVIEVGETRSNGWKLVHLQHVSRATPNNRA